MLQKVSVIIPAYNAEKTIKRCLDALLDQGYSRELYEIIVVNDGSIDKTPDIVKNYPVKYISQENNGPASARNKGAEAAEGMIILFTDSDCVPDKDWISEMVKPFDNPEVAAVKGAYRTHQKGIVARFSQLEFEERFEMLKRVQSIDMVDTYSAGFRRDVFLKMGGFDCSFPVANNEDTELSYRMWSLGLKMVFNPNAIVYHLNHPDSIRRYARLKFWRGYWRMVVYKRFPEKMIKDTYTPKTLKLQVILSPLLAAGLLLAASLPAYGLYPFLLIVLCFIFTSIPFILMSFKKDPVIALLAPPLLFIRASSIGLGVLWGMLRKN